MAKPVRHRAPRTGQMSGGILPTRMNGASHTTGTTALAVVTVADVEVVAVEADVAVVTPFLLDMDRRHFLIKIVHNLELKESCQLYSH